MNFIFISFSDPNLLRKKSVKQKIKKTMAYLIFQSLIENSARDSDCSPLRHLVSFKATVFKFEPCHDKTCPGFPIRGGTNRTKDG